MSQTPIQWTVKSILTVGKPYAIPRYQRKFTWGIEQAGELFDDINSAEKDEGVFLGTAIFQDAQDGKEVSVVDGQQRLTTLSLLIVAIRNRAKTLSQTMADRMSTYVVFTHDVTGEVNGYRIKPSKKIDQLFSHIANPRWDALPKEERYPASIDGYGTKRQVKRLEPILSLFIKKLEHLSLTQLQQLAEKVLQSYFYVFRVSTVEESMTLFERINARGLRLEVSDLIKTELFSHDIPDIDKKWEAVENATGDSPTKLLKYFFYTQGGHVTKKQLFKKMKALPIEPTERLARICNFSEFYSCADVRSSSALKTKEEMQRFLESICATWIASNEAKLGELLEPIIALRSFGVSQHIPLAYSMLIAASRITDRAGYDMLLKLLSNLEHYHYANTVICNRGGNDVEELYASFAMDFAQTAYRSESDMVGAYRKLSDALTKKLSEEFVKKAPFVSEFMSLDYEEEEDRAAILYAFDRLNNRNVSSSSIKTPIFRPYEEMRKLVTLDHIYPQTPSSGIALPNLHNVGNLVAMSPGINSKLGNELPSRKFEELRKLDAGDLAGFRVLKDLLDGYSTHAVNWTEAVVESRAKQLGDRLYTEVLALKSFS